MPTGSTPQAAADAAAAQANDSASDAVIMAVGEPPQALSPSPEAQQQVLLRAPIEMRSASLAVLAVVAGLYALHWAAAVVVPLLLGLMGSYALEPIVRRMVQVGLPRLVAAVLLVLLLLGGVATTAYTLSDDAVSLVEELPAAASKLRRALANHGTRAASDTIDKMQKAATELERAAADGTGSTPAVRGVTKVQVERAAFNVKDYLLPGTLGLATAVGQAVVVVFATFFLLASGDTFRRKLVRIASPTFAQKKLTLQALDEINLQIQRYLLLQVFTSALVGAATWLAFWWIGVERAAVWGVVAFVLNFIPYFGQLAFTGAAALMGFVQFGSFEMAAVVGGAALVINSLEGYVLTPWLTGRAARMNSVAIFVGVLAWGWLWGLWGLFLAVPILVVIKAVCDRVDDLKAVGELLGD